MLLENNNIINLGLLETEYIVPPSNKKLILGSIQWPENTGNVGDMLRFTEPGVLSITDDPIPIYSLNPPINKLLYFENSNGKINSSNIEISRLNKNNISLN